MLAPFLVLKIESAFQNIIIPIIRIAKELKFPVNIPMIIEISVRSAAIPQKLKKANN